MSLQPLDKTLRNKLERAVREARDVAEAAARAAVEQLGVGEPKPYAHLSADEKDLRRRLRIHGRQLGDFRHAKKETQEIDRLVEEIAYEHWHRMLFARFLAENNLLMYPDPEEPVPVSLEECEDLAPEEGAKNGWELASRFAARMLPQIFRPDSPVFQLPLPPEHQQKLERILADLPAEVFRASDSLGWVYQFWQAKRKDEVNASEVKIGARELPAVTQLFTEPYMVAFLLDNSLGAWWAARRLTEADLKNANSEEELRRKASLPGVPLEYLRFVKGEDGKWTPAAGTFGGWPKDLIDLKVLDPCCGSGHFLVAAFLMLVPMRMETEVLSAREAADSVLRGNLHGLEIDRRCVELAAFALALAAWKYPDAGGYRPLPELNVACTGIGPESTEDQWIKLAEQSGMPTNNEERTRIRNGLSSLHALFSQAPILGSLINPKQLGATVFAAGYDRIAPYLEAVLKAEKADDETRERAVAAAGMVMAAELLANEYALIITNVPYLTAQKQSDGLREYIQERHPDAKADLATAMLDRILISLTKGGSTAVVNPNNWLFLPAYKHLRKRMLRAFTWKLAARLGPGAFEGISGEIVNVALLVVSNENPADDALMASLDATTQAYVSEKASSLNSDLPLLLPQEQQRQNPDARVILEKVDPHPLLASIANSRTGTRTGDNMRLLRCHWEANVICPVWTPMQTTVKSSLPYGGRELVLRWDEGEGDLQEMDRLGSASIQGANAWGQAGVAISLMGSLPATLYTGEKFDMNCGVLWPRRKEDLATLWALCSSSEYNAAVRKIDQQLKLTTATLVKIPVDLDKWRKIALRDYPSGLPEPESDDPTQWLFHGRPEASTAPLQVAVARLLGYRWPTELDDEMRLSKRARALVKRCDELTKFADDDGIVCIPSVRGEPPAADRLLNLLAAAYGEKWSNDTQAELLKQADHAGKSLDSWLREKFFAQHCDLFHQRPFIWHVWDGLRDGFEVLINYHKLDRKNLETLTYTYLGDWIARQKQDKANGVGDAEEKLLVALALQKRLELILKGEEPYDIFVRWKPIERQPIGWDPDINDGVRLNIRPFMSVPDVKRKGAGVLRDKPKIDWAKDRGKDVESAPWYPAFKGDRINDHHLSLAEKRAARGKAAKEVGT